VLSAPASALCSRLYILPLLSALFSLLFALGTRLSALCSLLPSPCPRQHHSHTRKCFNLY
jgi:hypothetical protein